VPNVLILGDSTRSPEMRHEVPLAIPDPFLYAEANGRRVVVVSSLESQRVRETAPELEVIVLDALGIDELLAHDHLELRRRLAHPLRLERADDDDAPSVQIGRAHV